ncbi:uncharacterized protein SETTUDRAFT_137673 [Exserohilum turcica Et28A]|uniref:Opioid growth factor receptor (OGFr) conserved domain-containing protein n=1 Tax=Exserohilum turcicum (strain 28A) TaxID=671987 RepID=R0IJ77_EXST2|nr:uncharacterized protein SETTUDRAFT_137673 [Exserohilum turcica Et28A]EOA85200.1 hypothetical protein SETTUDRAFT_137673 [Exserohilum turcica Et28A]
MDRALDHQEQGKALATHAAPCKTIQPPSSMQSPQPTVSTAASTDQQPKATGPDHAKRRTQHISTTSEKRFKMGPSTSSQDDKDSAASRSQLIVRFYDPDIKAKDAKNRTLEEILAWPDSQLEASHNFVQMLFPLPEGSMYNWEAPVIDLAVMQAFRSRSELRQQLRRSFERMLSFYGFRVSAKSETELKKQNEDKDAAETKATTAGTSNPLLASTPDAAEQKMADAGHTMSSTQAATGVTKTETYTDASAPKVGISLKRKSTFPPGAHRNVSVSNPLPYHIIRASNWRKQFQNWAVRFDHNHLRITRIIRCLRVLGLEKESTAFFAALERVFNHPGIEISDKSMTFWRLAATRPLHWAPDDQKCKWLEAWEKEQDSLKRTDEAW